MNSSFSLAVHALVFLHHRRQTLSSEELALNICTNPATVRKTLAKLKAAGFVEAKEGAGGGYAIAPGAEDVTLDKVADALGIVFVSVSWKSGDTDRVCLISSGMGSVMDDMCEELDALCREHLSHKTIADIEALIFKPKKFDIDEA